MGEDGNPVRKPAVPFNPKWTKEEAWAYGYNADGTPRTDADWASGLDPGVPFNPDWSPAEAWKHGYNADGTIRTDLEWRLRNVKNASGRPPRPSRQGTLVLRPRESVRPVGFSSDEEDEDETPAQRRLRLRNRDFKMRERFKADNPHLDDPMQVLEDYVEEHRLRVVDLFMEVC